MVHVTMDLDKHEYSGVADSFKDKCKGQYKEEKGLLTCSYPEGDLVLDTKKRKISVETPSMESFIKFAHDRI